MKVVVYEVEGGNEVTRFDREAMKLHSWIRYFSWNPTTNHVALVNGRSVILWKPFENKAEIIFQLKEDETVLTHFNGFSHIHWADGGKKLLLRDAENTIFVWDSEKNVNWRPQRPTGTELKTSSDLLFVNDLQAVISLDSNRKVRFWKL